MQGFEEKEIVDRPETILSWIAVGGVKGVARRPAVKRIDKCNRVYLTRHGNDRPAM